MSSELEKNIINDFYKYLSIDEIAEKYKEYGTTTYIIKKIIKDNNLTRKQPSKILKILGDKYVKPNINTHIPIERSYKVEKVIKEGSTITLKQDDEILYDNRVIKQKIPKNPVVNVVKQEEENDTGDNDMKNILMEKLKSVDNTLQKVRAKKNNSNK